MAKTNTCRRCGTEGLTWDRAHYAANGKWRLSAHDCDPTAAVAATTTATAAPIERRPTLAELQAKDFVAFLENIQSKRRDAKNVSRVTEMIDEKINELKSSTPNIPAKPATKSAAPVPKSTPFELSFMDALKKLS